MPDPPRTWIVEELRREHDRSGFSCGHETLDEFIRRFASQNRKSGISRTFVAVEPGERVVRGYCTLSAGAVSLTDVPDALAMRLPRYPVPVAHLGRLAVDQAVQGQGLGTHLLIDALARILHAADSIGIHAIEVIAIDEAARRFCLKYGFVASKDDPHHLYLAIGTARKLRLA